MEIRIKVGPVILLELRLFQPEQPTNFLIVHATNDEDDDDRDPGDMFGGGKK